MRKKKKARGNIPLDFKMYLKYITVIKQYGIGIQKVI